MILEEIWSVLEAAGVPVGRDLRVAKVGRSPTPGGRVTLLVFAKDEAEPKYAIYIPRDVDASARVAQEFDLLTRIRSHLAKDLRTSLPEPLAVSRSDGGLLAVHTALPGRPGTGRTAEQPQTLEDACRWLGRLQCQTMSEPRPLKVHTTFEEYQEALLLFEQHLMTDQGQQSTLKRLQNALDALAPERYPTVACHGDFWLGNIMYHAGRVAGVIDWEWATLDGDPLFDVAHLLLAHTPDASVYDLRRLQAWLSGSGMCSKLHGPDVLAEVFVPLVAVVRAVRDWRRSGELSIPGRNRFVDVFARLAVP